MSGVDRARVMGPLDMKTSIEETEEPEDYVDGGISSAPISRRASDEDSSVEPPPMVDKKLRFWLFHTFLLPAQSGITTITKLGATASTGPRILVSCRDDSVHCIYFAASTEDDGDCCFLTSRSRVINAIPVEKPYKICALSCFQFEGNSQEAAKDYLATIACSPKPVQESDMTFAPLVALSIMEMDPEDVAMERPLYASCELLSPPYGCCPLIWRPPVHTGETAKPSLLVPHQNHSMYHVHMPDENSAGVLVPVDSPQLDEVDITYEKPIGAIEFWNTPDGLHRITAVARGCRSEISLTKYNFQTGEKVSLWHAQHDSMTQKLKYFKADPQNDQGALLVLGLCEMTVIYLNVDTTARPKRVILPESSSHDLVTCCDVADIDRDGFPEIILGTYGKAGLVYKLVGEEATLLHVIETALPVYFVAFLDMTKRSGLDLVLVTQKALHVYSL